MYNLTVSSKMASVLMTTKFFAQQDDTDLEDGAFHNKST